MRHHSSRKRACRRRTKSSGRQLVPSRLGSCVKASWLVDIDDAAQLAPSRSGLFLPIVVLPGHHSAELLAKLQLHSAGRGTHHTLGSIPYLWSGFYTARDPLVAPAPPGLVGSAGFYSATQRDLIPGDGFLEASAEASRAVAGAGRRPPAGGRPLLDAFATGREVLQLYGPSCTVVPACST